MIVCLNRHVWWLGSSSGTPAVTHTNENKGCEPAELRMDFLFNCFLIKRTTDVSTMWWQDVSLL